MRRRGRGAVILLALIALATLAANGATRLRHAAVAFLAVALCAAWIASATAPPGHSAVVACAGIVAAALLYISAGRGSYGEQPGWRLWLATIVAAGATPAAFAAFRTVTGDTRALPLWGPDPTGVAVQVAAFWLLASGMAILLTARSAVRMSLGALLMVTGVQLLVRLVGGPQLVNTLLFSWLQVTVALVGSFLVVNERAARDAA